MFVNYLGTKENFKIDGQWCIVPVGDTTDAIAKEYYMMYTGERTAFQVSRKMVMRAIHILGTMDCTHVILPKMDREQAEHFVRQFDKTPFIPVYLTGGVDDNSNRVWRPLSELVE